MAEQARLKLAKMGKSRIVHLLDGEVAAPGQSAIQSKYRNKKVQTEEASFASEKEHRRYRELKLLVAAGKISDLKLQVRFELAPPYIYNGKKIQALRYFADFVYTENGHTIVEDVKGCLNGIYAIKRHLMATVHGIAIRET